MCSLGVKPGVHKQTYRVDFSSFSLSMFFPVLSGLLWLLFLKFLGRKPGWIFTPLSCALLQMAKHPGPSEIRTERKEMQLVGVDSTLSEPQLEWMERKFSLLKNFDSCGLSLRPPPAPPLLHDCLRDRQKKMEKRKRTKGGRDFHILSWTLGVLFLTSRMKMSSLALELCLWPGIHFQVFRPFSPGSKY